MKKYRLIGPLLAIIIMLICLLSINLIKNSYKNEASISINNILAGLREKNPEIDDSYLLNLARKEKDIDLTKYGIYESKDLLEYRKSEALTKKLGVFLSFFTLSALSLYFYLLKKNIQNNLNMIISDLENINKGLYDIRINNGEEEFAKLQNEMFKITVKLKEEAENANFSKNQLKKSLEDISHQVKTPIASINLLLENMQDPEISQKEKKELLTYVQIEVDAITNLVLMLLDLALLDSGTVQFNFKEIKLDDLLDECIEILEPIRKEKAILIHKEVGDISYIGDRKWEKELYLNLIKNALEYSNGKHVNIHAKNTPSYLEVCLENETDYIDDSIKEKLFERFYKFSSKDNNYGIGLNLCKMIVEANNGKIRLETEGDLAKFIVRYYKKATL